MIASGGCGALEHFSDVFEQADADAALAASLFHFGELTVPPGEGLPSDQEDSCQMRKNMIETKELFAKSDLIR